MMLGYHRAGFSGMAIAWLMFTWPSLALMAAFALLFDATSASWTLGLLAAAVAVVFHAVTGMARSMASTPRSATIAVASGIAVLALPNAFTHLGVIILAGLIGAFSFNSLIDATPQPNADASAHGTESDTDGVTPEAPAKRTVSKPIVDDHRSSGTWRPGRS